MEHHRAKIADYRHREFHKAVVRFARDAATDACHRREGDMREWRQYPAEHEQQQKTRETARFDRAVDAAAVVEDILDRCKPESDHSRKNDPVKDVVEILPEE